MSVVNLETCSEAQFKRFFRARDPQACDRCWDRWEEEMSEFDPDGLMSLEECMDQFGHPEFNPECETCVRQYTEEVTRLEIKRVRLELLRETRNVSETGKC